MNLPSYVKIVEVGPRDGLQNEIKPISASVKINFINQLSETGLPVIEVTSFSSPRWIPQLSDNQEVYKKIKKRVGVEYPVLIPNLHGLESALEVDVKEIAVFATPSEEFARHNTNCTVAESIERIEEVITVAKKQNLKIRAYLSCVMGCPYEGEMDPKKVADLAKILFDLGCYEISLGDTIGTGTVLKTQTLIDTVSRDIPKPALAVHFHDTYGQALTNIFVALQNGIAIVDSSVAGLGGCPYAKGASGNVATEDVVYMLNGMNIETGVNLAKLIEVGRYITKHMDKQPQSKVNQVFRI